MIQKNDLGFNPFQGKDPLAIRDNIALFKDKKSLLLWEGKGYEHPTITIAIPTYRCELLHLAIESCIKQEGFDDYEVLIVDNNMNTWPQTLDYIKQLHNPHIRYYRNEENIGLFGNWNRLLELARGEYMVFCHADDMLVKDTLKKLWDFHLTVEPEAAILGRSRDVDLNGKLISEFKKKRWMIGLPQSLPYYKLNKRDAYARSYDTGVGEMFKTSCAREIGGWNPDSYPSSDQTFFFHYHRRFGCYRLNEIVRTVHIGINTSYEVGQSYINFGYYIREEAINKYYGGNKFLKWVEKLRFEHFDVSLFSGEQCYQPLWYKIFSKIYYVILNFRLK